MVKVKGVLLAGLVCSFGEICVAEVEPLESYADMSMEELMDVQVYSVAKKHQTLADTAAAAFIITQEDIRHAGATSIPDALRMAPGVQVAQVNAHAWAISIRGFNDRFSNKLLVMIDGRSVYSPLFAGTYWSGQDVMLEDVERIEVIRGPGGTVWGANAVNGVINIRTKHSNDAQGVLVSAQGGNFQSQGSLRYGGKLGEDGRYRVYAKGKHNSAYLTPQENDAQDQWDTAQGGFRVDYNLTPGDELTVLGDIMAMDGQEISGSNNTQGSSVARRAGNLTAKLTHQLEGGEWYLQSYYNYDQRIGGMKQEIDTLDMEFQYRQQIGNSNEVTWGLDYRMVTDELSEFNNTSFSPDRRMTHLYTGFIQDQWHISESLRLTVGSKFEHNDYSGFEFQPSARLLWKLSKRHSTWAAVSRAVRTPSRSHHNMQIDLFTISKGSTTYSTSIKGNDNFNSEDLLAFEWGYRGQLTDNISVDIATFYNIYENLISKYDRIVTQSELFQTFYTIDNGLEGESYGVELYADWKVTDNWKLQASYSWLDIDVRENERSRQLDSTQISKVEGKDPQNQYSVRSKLSLPYELEFDTSVYYVDSLKHNDIPSYTRLDLRLGWKPISSMELSVAGQNLLDDKQPEFATSGIRNSEVPRSVYGKMVWRW